MSASHNPEHGSGSVRPHLRFMQQGAGACFSIDLFLRLGPFPPPSPPPLLTALFEGFSSTMDPSDSSPVPRQLRLLDFLSRPGIAPATAGQTRSLRFRRAPFLRDVASDPGRATGPRIAAPHMLPSAPVTASAPAREPFRGALPRPKRLLGTLRRGRRLPRRTTRYRAGATPYPDRTFTGWNAPAFLAHQRPPLPGIADPTRHSPDPGGFAARIALLIALSNGNSCSS